MSKKIKNMLSILFVAVLTMSAFCIPASAAEDDLTISISTDEKDSVTAKSRRYAKVCYLYDRYKRRSNRSCNEFLLQR